MTTSARCTGLAVLMVGSSTLLACSSEDPPTAPAPAATQLAVQPVANQTARTAFTGPVTVQIQDASGALFPSATNDVTLGFGINAGTILWHASGRLGSEIFEPIDPGTPAVFPGPAATFGDEITGMVLDPATGLLMAGDIDANLSTIDPANGAQTIIGMVSPNFYLGGLAFDGVPRLLGVMQSSDSLYVLDLATGAATSLGQIVLAGETITGATGLATDPITGTIYGILKLASGVGRARTLVTIDPATLGAFAIGTLGEDGMADLAFLADGTLVGVTGDGATNPETLWTIDTTSGATTLIIALGNGDDGESIAAVPAQLMGTLTVAAVAGVATFPGLMIDAAANGYSLRATAAGLTSGVSAPFNVTP